MSPPVSDSFRIVDISHAGRGVISSCDLPADSLVLGDIAPAFHVIFRQYRKEVCAQCFHYDRGRTLAVRENDIGKVFCSIDCQSRWHTEVDPSGLHAWQSVEIFLKSKKCRDQEDAATKPNAETISSAWQATEVKADIIRQSRDNALLAPISSSKALRKRAKAIQDDCSGEVDADILSYLLSGVLFKHRYEQSWSEDVLALAMADEPYDSLSQLAAHCRSYLQLLSILPVTLLFTATADLCLSMARADHHNAFGIRAGSDDNEEYMGYAVYPAASFFNHSCRPNIAKQRNGRYWTFRTSKSIAIGEECCITYLGGDERDMSVLDRQARLKEHWGFQCNCERCVEESQ